MARKTSEELNDIKKKYNVSRLWSWSRYNAYHNSKYEYFLKYIKKAKEDRCDCIYTTTGGMAHDILEKLYKNKITYKDMIDEFEDAWITAGIAELKFDRNDEERNKKIANKYYYDLQHFFKNHQVIKSKLEIERFITVKVGSNFFQGYIDGCFKDDDGNYIILDWKTSSIYKGKKAEQECGQLLLYAIALNQLGVPFNKIKICWNFLKYVNVQCEQANGKWSDREIERYEIGSKLHSSAKMWLKKLGYEDELMEYLDLLVQTNNIECLPKEVQEKFKFNDCYVYVDITEELINKLTEDITNTIIEIIIKEKEYEESKDDSIFWESDEEVEKQSYYFATLCAYSPNLHLPYKKYLDKLKQQQEDKNNMFSGVGKETSDKDDDLSWLNEL